METTIEIKGIQEKTSKAGRIYHSFDTSEGTMTCFEGKLVDILKTKIGQKVNVEFAEANGFKNIKKILDNVITEKVEAKKAPEEFAEARAEKNKSIYTSYAKDIFLGLLQDLKDEEHPSWAELMEKSITLVKQAIREF